MNLLAVTRADIEEFLFAEAELLDCWQLNEWRALFINECRYLVPAAGIDPESSPADSLFYIADDGFRLSERIKRLMKRSAHAEYPRSAVVRLVSNVRILERTPESMRVKSNFATFRMQRGNADTYVGHHEYLLVAVDSALRIREKRTVLHMEALRPHGRITLIV